jgi:hypothetical protein
MAIYHLRVSTFSRARGQSAVAAACYRSGTRGSHNGQRFDYRPKAPSVACSWLTGWNGTRSSLWNKAEQRETRRNSTVAREIQASIPRELNNEQGEALCRRFGTWVWTTYGTPVDSSIHRPRTAKGDNHNPHAHFLFVTRRYDPVSHTFGKKTREWDARDYEVGSDALKLDETTGRAVSGKGCVAQVRETWEEMANEALRAAGRTERIDRRSLTDQGIERAAVNVSRATLEIGKRGVATDESEEMDRRRRENRKRAKLLPIVGATRRPTPTPQIDDATIEEEATIENSEAFRTREVEREAIRATYRAAVRRQHEVANPVVTLAPDAHAPRPQKRRRPKIR